MKKSFRVLRAWAVSYGFLAVTALAVILMLIVQSCTKEKIIIYSQLPDQVTLLYPPNSGSSLATTPVFSWEPLSGAESYQIQLSTNEAFTDLVFSSATSDTFYSHEEELGNDVYYWRVRAKNADDIWGDWSEAMVWSFRINDSVEYFDLTAQIQTPGIAQDVLVQDNTAYVADGQADLTLIDVTDPVNPQMIGNVDTYNDDFAKAVWKVPGDNYIYVADMDGKIQVLDIRLPLDPLSPNNRTWGLDQNLQELMGLYIDDTVDTVYIFTVSSGTLNKHLGFYQFVYDEDPPRPGDFYFFELDLPADGNGVYFDTVSVVVEYYDSTMIDSVNYVDSTYYEAILGKFICVAAGQSGLRIINVSVNHTFDDHDTTIDLLQDPKEIGSADTPSSALALHVIGGFAYVADDRGGLQIFDLPDTIPAFDHEAPYSADPLLISGINTSGRTKDVHVVGGYCFIADGSGGLKVIDVSSPYNPVFLAAYATPYAYGVWADEDYIYLADRDNGLMIFENRIF